MDERADLRRPQWWLVIVAPLLAGALTALAGPPLVQPWLVLFGWIVFAWTFLRPGMRWGRSTLAGAAFGVGHNAVLAAALEFPINFAVPLAAALAVSWAVLGLLLGLLLPRLGPRWALAVIPAAATAVDALGLMAIPVFGTAQSVVRALAPWPWTLGVSAYAGHGGLVLLVVAASTGVAVALESRGPRRRGALTGVIVASAAVVILAGTSLVRASREPARTVRVAAAGWTYEVEGAPLDRSGTAAEQVDRLLAPLVLEAASRGATIVVAPEVAFWMPADEREDAMARLSDLAVDSDVTLVTGFFDVASDTNRAALFGLSGDLVDEYRKTHLIMGVESYRAGNGELVVFAQPEWTLGVLICQDDNFTDLSRAYGRRSVDVLAVPTNDWHQVQEFHLQNSVLRTVESGFAMIRGATNGVSAIIDADGRVLARMDHHAQGTGIVVADLPLYAGGTLYDTAGDWIAIVSGVFLVIAAIVAWRRRSKS